MAIDYDLCGARCYRDGRDFGFRGNLLMKFCETFEKIFRKTWIAYIIIAIFLSSIFFGFYHQDHRFYHQDHIMCEYQKRNYNTTHNIIEVATAPRPISNEIKSAFPQINWAAVDKKSEENAIVLRDQLYDKLGKQPNC